MRYCTRCGAPELEGAKFCPTCGKCYEPGDGFNWKNALNWRPFESFIEKTTHFIEPASRFALTALRRGADFVFSQNARAPSYIIWNLLALLLCSVPMGLVGVAYSIRVLQLKKNGDASPELASYYAKLWSFWRSSGSLSFGRRFCI